MLLPLFAAPCALGAPVKVGTFAQEFSTFYTKEGLPSSVIEGIYIDDSGALVVRTPAGWAEFKGGAWQTGTDAAKALESRYNGESDRAFDILAPYGSQDPSRNITMGPFAIARDGSGYVIANGVLVYGDGSRTENVIATDSLGRGMGGRNVTAVTIDRNGMLWFACPAGLAFRFQGNWGIMRAEDGLPYNQITCIAHGPGREIWLGTTKGVITTRGAVRRDNQAWEYRQGKAWLPNDHVNDIAVDANGNAWVATNDGVALIERRLMTLPEKAAHYEEEIERYIKRTPFGYTAEARLARPGDRSEVTPIENDNDGLWTAMYGTGECFAYAATGDPKAKERAKQAFEALRFLQKVTQGGEHSPPKGYVARTILPADGPDPNIGSLERDQKSLRRDRLWKSLEPRWPKSADGKWYWKGDTSSGELDGHYFFYPAYYDLVADTEEEKERVREVVRDLTDHLIEHDFMLIDHDGTVTRWANFNPQHLNHDRKWIAKRGLNSLSMLSYLAVAEHVTGDPKYGEASRMLIEDHGYAQNAMRAKIQYGIGSGNQSDDELAIMSFYNLIRYTKNEELRERMRYSFFTYWRLEYPEMNPFFNFAYAASCQGTTYINQSGTISLEPWRDWSRDAIATLRSFSFDRVNWARENSHRSDLVLLPRQQAINLDASAGHSRGYRVNNKVLPVQERHFNHWNTDPWQLDYPGDGRTLGNGTVFLLPYYMGLYHGFIAVE